MEIITDSSMFPRLKRELVQVDELQIFCREHNTKQPAAIYNVSFGKILEPLNEIAKLYASFDVSKVEDKDYNNAQFLKVYRDLLYALREHLDDCFSILKVFINPEGKSTMRKNQYLWLDNNKTKELGEVLDSIKPYKEHLDLVVNEMKHNNSILGSISFFDKNYPDEHCLGYYVSNVTDGLYQPVESIHKSWRNCRTAFSFKRDISYHLFHVYMVSEVISDYLRSVHDEVFTKTQQQVEQNEQLKETFSTLVQIPRIFMPDEYEKPVPSVAITGQGELRLLYPSRLTIKANKLSQFILTHTTDGVTGSYALLYGEVR